MIKVSIGFNGEISITLTGENEADRRLLELAFNGNEVKRIDPKDGSIVLKLTPSKGANDAAG